MFSYEEYEFECQKQIERNEMFLEMFEKDLMNAGLSTTTISKHLSNVDFYINTYLLREEPLDMESGCFKIDMFLGYFFYTQMYVVYAGKYKNNCCEHKEVL